MNLNINFSTKKLFKTIPSKSYIFSFLMEISFLQMEMHLHCRGKMSFRRRSALGRLLSTIITSTRCSTPMPWTRFPTPQSSRRIQTTFWGPRKKYRFCPPNSSTPTLTTTSKRKDRPFFRTLNLCKLLPVLLKCSLMTFDHASWLQCMVGKLGCLKDLFPWPSWMPFDLGILWRVIFYIHTYMLLWTRFYLFKC